MSRKITLDDLRLLIELVRLLDGASQTLSAAESHLRRNGHPGLKLSEWLSEIEDSLGGPKAKGSLLVERGVGKRRVILQAIAHEIADIAQQMLTQWDERVTAIETSRQRVNVAMSNALVGLVMPRVLKESTYLRDFPNADIKILDGEPDENVRRVVQSEVHFAVGPRGTIPANCEFELLCRWKRVLLFRKGEAKHERFGTLEPAILRRVLQDECVIIPTRAVIPEVENFLLPPKRGRIIKVSQAAHRHLYVAAGLGLAITHIPDDLGDDSVIAAIDLTPSLGETDIGIYFAKSKRARKKLPTHVNALADAIVAMLKTDGGAIGNR